MNHLPTIILLLLSILFIHPFEGGGDFYHHTNTGKQILEQGTFPYLDIYTHTAHGQPWIAYAWGSGIILYLIYTYFGPIGITFLVWLTGTITILLLYYLLKLSKISKPISLLVILASLAPILTRFPNRPEIFTYPLILGLLITDKLRLKSPKLNLLFPLIIVIWANLYGSSTIAGLGLILLFILRQLITDKFKILTSQKSFYLVSLISYLVSLINPNTYKSILYMFLYIPKVSQYEGEWAGIWTILNFTPDSYILLFQYLFVIYFIFLVLFFLTLLFSIKIIFRQKLLALLSLTILVPIFAFRHLPLGALLSTPLLAHLLNQQKNKTLNILILIASVAMISLMLWLRPIGILSKSDSSDQLINFIKSNNLQGKSLNHNTTGSFLSYSLYPDIKVFFDTRDDLFKENQAFQDLYDYQMNSQSIMPLLEKYQIDIVIADYFTDTLNYKDLFSSQNWSIVYLNDRYIVAIPTPTAAQKGLTTIKAADPFSSTGSKPGMEKQAEEYYQDVLTKLPTSSNNLMLLIQTLIAQNKYPEAISRLNELKTPNDPTAPLFEKQKQYLLLKSYLQVKNCSQAEESLTKLESTVKGNFIFNPSKKLDLIDSDLKAIFYKSCQQDLQKGNQFMKEYLNQQNINPKEKIKFQQQYLTI